MQYILGQARYRRTFHLCSPVEPLCSVCHPYCPEASLILHLWLTRKGENMQATVQRCPETQALQQSGAFVSMFLCESVYLQKKPMLVPRKEKKGQRMPSTFIVLIIFCPFVHLTYTCTFACINILFIASVGTVVIENLSIPSYLSQRSMYPMQRSSSACPGHLGSQTDGGTI